MFSVEVECQVFKEPELQVNHHRMGGGGGLYTWPGFVEAITLVIP